MKISKDGDCKTSLGNIFHCLTVLAVKKVFVKTSQNVSVSFVPTVSPTMHHHEQPAWLRLLSDLRVDTGRLL